jgi:hypothetical protein
MALTFVLAFVLCASPDCEDDFEHGTITARSCAAAEAYLRAGLRPHQWLHILGCEPRQVGVAGR